ncbi:MAG: rRNA maturation RNase YbeY [Cyanobacteria bacterium P01_F01_bin.150]
MENDLKVDLALQSDIEKAIDLPSYEQWQEWITAWLTYLNPDYSPIQSYELSLLLTSDAAIQALNLQYRQFDKPTNVLAFALLDDENLPPEVLAVLPMELGDIVISVETAQRQAHEHNHSLGCELAWLASHGLLHLLGWDHPDDMELQQMLEQQTALLRMVGFELSDQFYYAAEVY